MKATTPSGESENARPIDFARIKSNAINKGYEPFVVDSMVERSVSMAMSSKPRLLEMDVGGIQAEVGKQFLANIERAGGFRFAYTEQLKVLREVGKVIPEQRLELLASTASSFLDAIEKRLPGVPDAKERLIEQARTTASALRAFGLDDRVVGKRLGQHPVLVKQGVAQTATERIDGDREAGIEARTRARLGAMSSRSERSDRAASGPRMR